MRTASSISLLGNGTFSLAIGIGVAIVIDDGALLQKAQAFLDLTDIALAEVPRDPQGTRFGKNAATGVIIRTLTGLVGAFVTPVD